jgi:hypothetical protein
MIVGSSVNEIAITDQGFLIFSPKPFSGNFPVIAQSACF